MELNEEIKTNDWSITDSQIKEVIDLLNTHKPKSIIELGSGVSSEIFKEYQKESDCNFLSIDHDPKYAKDCATILPLNDGLVGTELVCYYEGFDELVKKKGDKYDFVFIDGPYSYLPFRRYSRIEIFDLIPFLSDECVVMMHDTERMSVENTLNLFEETVASDFEYVKKVIECAENPQIKRLTVYFLKKI